MKQRSDVGSATIWVLIASALFGMVAIVTLVMSAGFVAHRRAAAAADLAALAGASRSLTDQHLACSAAEHVAAQNGATLKSCALQRASLLVYVVVDPEDPWLPAMLVPARAGTPYSSGSATLGSFLQEYAKNSKRAGLRQRVIAVPTLG